VQARHAFSFSFETIARMTTRIHFLANLLAHLDANFVPAYVLKGSYLTNWEISHHFLAESALVKVLLHIPLVTVVT
jgi:hypothetical protein